MTFYSNGLLRRSDRDCRVALLVQEVEQVGCKHALLSANCCSTLTGAAMPVHRGAHSEFPIQWKLRYQACDESRQNIARTSLRHCWRACRIDPDLPIRKGDHCATT